MLPRMHKGREVLVRLTWVFGGLVVACTFPTVDYAADGGGCVSEKCGAGATACGDGARAELSACTQECKSNPCKLECTSTFDHSIAQCITDCETCAASECTSPESDCASLAGGK